MVIVHEWLGGFRGGEYYFIIEGGRLMHISKYSTSREKHGDVIEYGVDVSRLGGREVVRILSSRSGIICLAELFPAEDIALDYGQRRTRNVPLSYLNNLEFTHLSESERLFLKADWREYYVPIIEELARLIDAFRYMTPYITLPQLAECQVMSGADYPISYLIPYGSTARGRSIGVLTRELHQLWVVMRILAKLKEANKLNHVDLNFEQSPYSAVASFSCRAGPCSLWYEFDLNPLTMCKGILWDRESTEALRNLYGEVKSIMREMALDRAPLRPDIAILSGGKNCDEITNGFRIEALIECKNLDYTYWEKDVRSQVIPYRRIFRPKLMVLASMKEVPSRAKALLDREGITVIENLHPRGGGIHELMDVIDSL